jgi:hypothetical protein
MFMNHASFALIVCQGYPLAKSVKEPRDDAGLERSEKECASPYYMALLCFSLGKNDLGFQWLGKSYEERDGWLMNLEVDFMLDDVRDDPRFSALLKKIGLQK